MLKTLTAVLFAIAFAAFALPVAAQQGTPILNLPAISQPTSTDVTVLVRANVTSQATVGNLFANAPAVIAPTLSATSLTPGGCVQAGAGGVLVTPSGSGCGPNFTGNVTAVGFSGTNGTFSSLTFGNCVQAGVGGLLTTASAPCGGGGGAVSSVAAASANVVVTPTTGAVTVDLAASPSVTGLTLSGLTATSCVSSNGSKALISGTNCVISVTAGGSGNVTASPTAGAVVVDLVANPTLTGTLTAVGVNVGGALGTATTIAASGTITDSNATPLAFSNTGTTTITSASTGATVGFDLNDTGSASTLFIVANNGLTRFSLSSVGQGTFLGGVAAGGSITGATTVAASGIISTSATGATAVTLSGAGPGITGSANTALPLILSSDTTGAHPSITLLNANATPNTGDLVDFDTVGPIVVARVGQFGGFCPGNGSTNAAQSACMYTGAGVPAFSAANGSIYIDFSGVHSTNLMYVNTSGASTSGTTWTAVTAF